MSGILGLMDIAKRSLMATQLGMEVTSNNISNVNTPGYSRQIVNYETSLALDSPYGPLGYGVQVGGIERAFDPFVATRLVQNTSLLVDYENRKAYLEQVGSLFNETLDGGLNDIFSGFWASWSDVSDNPSGSGERQALLNQAKTMADAFNYRADQLSQYRTALSQQISPTIEEINAHAARIAELNREIQATETPEHPANDLRDQRQMEINELAELVNISYYTTGDGTINVSLSNGLPLAQGTDAWSLGYEITTDDKVQINWEGPGGLTEDVTSAINGGALAAQIEVRDNLIVQYQEDLDQLAQELIFAVNSLHSQGVGLELLTEATSSYFVTTANLGDPLINNSSLTYGDRITTGQFNISVEDASGVATVTTINIAAGTTLEDLRSQLDAVAGISASIVTTGNENRLEITADADYSFGFSEDTSNALAALGINNFLTGDDAYSMGVNEALTDNYNLVAAGQIESDGSRALGDNRIALALVDLADQTIANLGDLTFDSAYRNLVTDIGLDAEEAGSQQDFYQGMVNQYTELRDSVSGVSLDEELTNLIKYQRAYQAAAQMISAADEMLQSLLSIKT